LKSSIDAQSAGFHRASDGLISGYRHLHIAGSVVAYTLLLGAILA